jgi:hypothetical protein
MIYEGAPTSGASFVDGRPHPFGDQLNPSWPVQFVGHWEGDTLVVDVVGFNEGGWIDMAGDPHTDRLHVIMVHTRKDLSPPCTTKRPSTIRAPTPSRGLSGSTSSGMIRRDSGICQENSIWMRRMLNGSEIPWRSRDSSELICNRKAGSGEAVCPDRRVGGNRRARDPRKMRQRCRPTADLTRTPEPWIELFPLAAPPQDSGALRRRRPAP